MPDHIVDNVSDLSVYDVRADGPAVVGKGPVDGPAVVVLDPLGEAKHRELPATWRPLTDDVRVEWWRLPAAARAGLTGESLPGALSDRHRPVHLVGVGDAALLTVSLAAERRDIVRSVVLVDPPWLPDEVWPASGASVFHVMTQSLPIGHPDVLAAIVEATGLRAN